MRSGVAAWQVIAGVCLGAVLVIGSLIFIKGVKERRKTESEESFRQIVEERNAKSRALVKRWTADAAEVKAKEMSDYTQLQDDRECERRQNVLRNFIALTRQIDEEERAATTELLRRLSEIRNPSENVEREVARLQSSGEKEEAAFRQMMETVTKFAESQLDAIQLLRNNKSRWTVLNGKVSSDDPHFFAEMQAALKQVASTATEVQRRARWLDEMAR